MRSVDVIVPCYRYGHFLRQCVESVLTQSLQNLRVLIIDDASPDNTAEVADDLARSDSRITVFHHADNLGHINTYNEGIEWASAESLLILSADDYLLPGALKRAADLMSAHPEVGLVHGKAIRSTDGKPPVLPSSERWRWRIYKGWEFISASAAGNIVCSPTAVVRTKLQQKIGRYRADLPHSGDLEMWLRFGMHGDVAFIDTHQAVYRRHADNMSHAYFSDGWLPEFQQRRAALDRFLKGCDESSALHSGLREQMMRSLAKCAIGRARLAVEAGDAGLSERLANFATDVYPSITHSWSWAKLRYKTSVLGVRRRALGKIVGSGQTGSRRAEKR